MHSSKTLLFLLLAVLAVPSFASSSKSQKKCETDLGNDGRGTIVEGVDKPVFVRMKEVREESHLRAIPKSKVTEWVFMERNRREMVMGSSTLNWLQRTIVHVNRLFERFGKNMMMENVFRSTFDKIIKVANGDLDALQKLVDKIRGDFLEATKKSIEAEMSYVRLYEQFFYLVSSAEKSFISAREAKLKEDPNADVSDITPEAYQGSTLARAILRYDLLYRQLIELQRLREIFEDGKKEMDYILAGDEQVHFDTYADVDNALHRTRQELERKYREIGRLTSWRNYRKLETRALRPAANQSDRNTFKLARVWRERESAKAESNYLLARYYVMGRRLDVLEKILAGEFKGLSFPFDSQSLVPIDRLFSKNRSYLENHPVFKDYFEEGEPGIIGVGIVRRAKQIDDENLYETLRGQQRQIRRLSLDWSDVWGQRIEVIKPLVDFTFSMVNIGHALRSAFDSTRPRSFAINMRHIAGPRIRQVGSKLARLPLIREWVPKDGAEFQPDNQSGWELLVPDTLPGQNGAQPEKTEVVEKHIARKREVEAVTQALEKLFAQFTEVTDPPIIDEENKTLDPSHLSSEIHELSAQEIRHHLDVVRLYLDDLGRDGQLDKPIARLLGSAEAVQLWNWMFLRATAMNPKKMPFDSIVAEWIVREQNRRRQLHRSDHLELAAQLTGMIGAANMIASQLGIDLGTLSQYIGF